MTSAATDISNIERSGVDGAPESTSDGAVDDRCTDDDGTVTDDSPIAGQHGVDRGSPDGAPPLPGRTRNWRTTALVAAVVYVWVRLGFILSSGVFETPDTQSYRSGQTTRPPIAAGLLSWLGDSAFVIVSAVVTSVGFVALAWRLGDARRKRWTTVVAVSVVIVSLLPFVVVYEHWLVPDSLIVGLALLLVALAVRPSPSRWYAGAFLVLAVVTTCTKEVGVAVVVLVSLIVALRGAPRVAAAACVVSVVLFGAVVLPGSSREGRVLWEQPLDSELTMERFRVIANSLYWPDLSPELADVAELSEECGMSLPQLFAETFRLTDDHVDFARCEQLWEAVDDVSQFDILVAHLRNPEHVPAAIERGFAPDMTAMATWGRYTGDHPMVMSVDRLASTAVAILPMVALAVTLIRRRERLIALVSLGATATALAATLVDPSSQDRHSIVFRILGFAIALVAISAATAPTDGEAGDAESEELELVGLHAAEFVVVDLDPGETA